MPPAKNFWSALKSPFVSVGNTITNVSHDIEHTAENIVHTVRQHPLESIAVLGTAVLGGAAIVLTGGLAAPEVAAGIGAEAAAFGLIGAEVGAEAAIGVGAAVGVEAATEASGALIIEELGAGLGLEEIGVDTGLEALTAEEQADAIIADAAAAEISDTIGLSVEEEANLAAQEAAGLPLEPDALIGSGEIGADLSQAEIDEFINGVDFDELIGVDLPNVNSIAELEEALISDSSLVSRLASAGSKGLNILSKVGAVAGIGLGVAGIIQEAKEIKDIETMSGKIAKVAEIMNRANRLQAIASGKEIEKLEQLGGILEEVGDSMNQIEQAGEILNVINQEELQVEKDNLAQTKILIKENRGETAAIKHSQVVLDNELQQLEKEEQKEQDISMRIATTLDRPFSIADFLKDISGFNTEKSKIEYVVENYQTFITLNQKDINTVLDMLNTSNALKVF